MHVNTTRKINILSWLSITLEGNWNYENIVYTSCLKYLKRSASDTGNPGQSNYKLGFLDLITYSQIISIRFFAVEL